MIRKVIREGRAKGVSDSDVLMYAKISAHSGIDIQFDKEATKINSEFEMRNSESENGRRYAIVALDNGNTYVTATRKVIKSETKSEQRKEISQFFNILLNDKPSLDIHTIEGDVLTITKAETAKKARDDYKTVNGRPVAMTDDEFRVKLNAESHIDELAEVSVSKKQKAADSKNHPFAKDGFTYRTAYFEDYDGKYYKITLSIGHNGTIATVYNVGEMVKSVPSSSAKIIAVTGSLALDETLSGNSIYQKTQKVNTSGEKNNALGENLEYADGFYEASQNRIVVNPEGKRTAERLLIHELDHAIRKDYSKRDVEGAVPYVTRIYKEAIEGVAPETREKILQTYKKTAKPGEAAATVMDETNAYYAEQVLSNKNTLEKLIEAEPTLKDKILSFFKGASTDYADVPKLSGAAKRYYRTYKKLFDEFSARNAQSNALEPNNNGFGSYNNIAGVSDNVRTTDDNKSENAHLSTLFEKNSQKTTQAFINQGNMHVSDRQYALSSEDTEKGKAFVSFVNSVNKMVDKTKISKRKHKIGALSESHKTLIQNLLEEIDIHTDLTGYELWIDGTGAQHIEIRHGKKGKADKSMNDNNIKAAVPWAVNNADNGSVMHRKNGEIKFSDRFKNSDGSLAPEILLEKKINADTIIVSECVPDSVSKRVYITSAYIKKSQRSSVSMDKKSPQLTPKTTFDNSAINSISENTENVKRIPEKTSDKQYALDIDLEGENIDGKVVNADGTPKILYHQTGEEFTVFDPRHKGSGSNDDGTPFGIFMKPEDNDIGLKGKKQMALYARIVKPLIANDRQQLEYELKKMSPKYAELMQKQKALTAEYQKKLEDAEKAWSQYAKDYRAAHPEATRSEIYKDKTFSKLFDAEDILTEEWIEKADALSTEAKEEIIRTLKKSGYDGVILKKDAGSGGRTVETYIALEPEQVKSATDNIGTFSPYEKDIQYALPIDEDGEEKISGAEVMGWLNKKSESDGKLDLEKTVARGLPYKNGKSSFTVGEIKKLVANSTREKVYSKADALKVVNRMSGTWVLTQRARDEIADTIWQFLNEAPDVEYRQDMAHDIAEYIVAKVLVDSKTENPDAIEAAEKLSYLRTGIGKLSFSDEDIAELRHAADEKGLKRLMGRWGFKGTKHLLLLSKSLKPKGMSPVGTELIQDKFCILFSKLPD